ncbi:sugar-binding domain-containing protein [Chitinophagaceae bacterium LWZ2-11]
MKKSVWFLLLMVPFVINAQKEKVYKSGGEDISTHGWRLWVDSNAAWKDDDIYLPADVQLNTLPVNVPTGGWQVLDDKQGISVTLPTTVEEHYWGKFGRRPYTKNEAQRGAGTSFGNGNYLGVSWWWRDVEVPAFKKGQRVIVSFRGARLRSEVYCNGKLCGYTIMGELPFKADITDAVQANGKARIAVRITNPGGHLDWIDFAQMQIKWGKYTLPPSHGFGGLDNDIKLAVRDAVSVNDLAALNKKELRSVHLIAEVQSTSEAYNGKVNFSISNKAGKKIWLASKQVNVVAGETKLIEIDATIDSAKLWDVDHPILYKAYAALEGRSASDKEINFGFRFFTPEGIGTDAKLVFNNKRIVPISAISWGFWGRNGLWPDKEMAAREVSAAKQMGLNCLQFHRNIGKPAILDEQDRMGLLRCEEPGGGKFALGARYARGPFNANGDFLEKDEKLLDAFKPKQEYKMPDTVNTSGIGPDGDGQTFWEKYAEEKILEMVKRDRCHPSLIMYTIQNESSEMDLRNPRIYRLFRNMHKLDPSRTIAFYSGGVPKDAQVLMLPYNNDISYAGKNNPFAGWQDIHTCGGPSNYLDWLYKDPQHFKQKQSDDSKKNIAMWGEMLGAGAPDNYDQLVHSFDKQHPHGYELEDAQKVLKGYHDFIDKYGFRKAFPTDSSLFTAIGYRTYYFWKRIIEQSRMDNINDYLVISGWESTTIDNHSGLVDNHRFFKADPAIIKEACKPEILVIQPRHMIVAKGDKEIVDFFIINETNRTGNYALDVNVKRPDGSVFFTTRRDVVIKGADIYGQLLADSIVFSADAEGPVKIEAKLTSKIDTKNTLNNSDEINVVNLNNLPCLKEVAVMETEDEVSKTLQNTLHVVPSRFPDVPATKHLDAIVIATKTTRGSLFEQSDKPKQGESILNISTQQFDDALARVKNEGTRLVLLPDNDNAAEAFAKALAAKGVVQYNGRAGNLNAPWFGSWFFVRKHWLLAGLPVDCAMDWRYGISAFGGPDWLTETPKGANTNGLMLDGKGIDVAVGYGADHNPRVGISGCVITYGKGEIVLYCLPQMVRSLQSNEFATNTIVGKKLLANALAENKP